MRKAFFVLLLLAASYAEFTLTAMDVLVDVDVQGGAHVTEKLHYIITSSYHISLYESNIVKTDIGSWGGLVGSDEVRSHLDNRVVSVENVIVRASPTSRCNPLAELCHGDLTVTYEAEPYLRADGSTVPGTGLLTVEQYKPRTTRYTLNEGALQFQTSELGDVVLGEDERLSFLLPRGAKVAYVNPLPSNTEQTGDGRQQLSWENEVLAHFSIVFEKEEGLDQEVIGFFMGARSKLYEFLSGPEGLPAAALVLILAGSYLYLQSKQKKAA
ncbi:MAG: hypothetical protein PHQ80_00365 [Candidatus ainarchaeum sp.]|nr:hypothetical protein [Candidatus ainarchaeum sp.]MDD5096340.1 hypothetical protein [Candidatus ainarchaeum sp.]